MQPFGQRRRAVARSQVFVGDVAAEPAGRRLAGPGAQRQAAERRRQRNRVLPERERFAPGRLARHLAEHVLGQRHQVVVVGVAQVELQHRELGVVLGRNPLVPEVTVDLEHTFDAPHRQPLQIQLGRDPHVQPHVERVVVGHERPRQRAAGDRLHHRRLDLEEPAVGQEVAHRRDDAAAHLEHAARVGVDDQIEVALAIADFDVLQAVPLLRQRQQALGEELQLRRPDGELAGFRAEQPSLHADPVAEIEQLEQLEVALRERVLAEVDLDARLSVREHEEVRLAEAADGEDASRRPHHDLCGVELLAGLAGVVLATIASIAAPGSKRRG